MAPKEQKTKEQKAMAAANSSKVGNAENESLGIVYYYVVYYYEFLVNCRPCC